MKIDRKTIAHLERLARIALAEEEADAMVEQLDRIVAYVEKLQSVDTSGIAPTHAAVLGSADEGRDDVPAPGLPRDVILKLAPDATDTYYRVPAVFGEESDDAAE